jgi:hypothetical protein
VAEPPLSFHERLRFVELVIHVFGPLMRLHPAVKETDSFRFIFSAIIGAVFYSNICQMDPVT